MLPDAELVALGRLEKLLVGRPTPEDVAQPRCQLKLAEMTCLTAATMVFDPVDKTWRLEHRLKDEPHRLFEVAAGA